MSPFASFIPQILRERPLLFWSGLLGALAIVGVLVPVDWNPVGATGLINRPEPLHAFSERVIEIDRALEDGQSVEVDAERASDIHLFLGVRRLVRAGDMSQNDMQQARELLSEMHRQLDREQTPASREAVREMWLDRLVEEIPRLDRDKVGRELAQLHDQIDAHLKTAERAKKDKNDR